MHARKYFIDLKARQQKDYGMEQGTSLWHEWRKSIIGASEASVILGIDPYRDREELLLEKLGEGKPYKSNPAMELGNKFEGPARALLFFELGIDFTPSTRTHPDLPWMGASLDGYCEATNQSCEIKYMGKKNFDLVKSSGAPLKHHYPQVQHQMAVYGLDKAYYAAYTLTEEKREIDQLTSVIVSRDDSFIQNLIKLEKEFWDEVLAKRATCQS